MDLHPEFQKYTRKWFQYNALEVFDFIWTNDFFFFFGCIVRLDSLAVDHHWAPLSACAAADNHSSSSLSEELLMWSDAQTGRLFAGGWERSIKESNIQTAADYHCNVCKCVLRIIV